MESRAIQRFTGPLPEAEEVADLGALLGLLDEVDLRLGADWVEQKIREKEPLEDRGWQEYRVAVRVVGMGGVVAEFIWSRPWASEAKR